MKTNYIYKSSLVKKFEDWFYSRGEFYSKLEVKFYMDGEPYFASQGAECSYRDYLQVKEEVKNIFTCYYVSGGGTSRDAGIWKKKETPKTITFEYIDNLIFKPLYTRIKINKFYSKRKKREDGNYNAFRKMDGYISWANNGHVLRDFQNGTYTAYPEQCGTPYIFNPIPSKRIEEIRKLLYKKCTN